MIATVAYWQMRFAGRRRRHHVGRWLIAGVVVLALLVCFATRPLDRFASSYVEMLVQWFYLLALWMPAYMAGVVTEEQSRGTLPQLVTTDLWPGDILLGRLLARLAEVGLALLTALPLLAFFGVFGGLHPGLILMVLWAGAPLFFALGSAGLLASVLARHTRDAVVGVYLVGGGLALAVSQLLPKLGQALHPLEVLRPALERGQLGESFGRLAIYSIAWFGIGSICLLIALLRFPRVWQRPFERAATPRRNAALLPVSDAPIPWKERRIHGFMLLSGVPGWLVMLLIATLGAAAGAYILAHAEPITGKNVRVAQVLFPVNAAKAERGFLLLTAAGLFAASLVVGARTSTTVTGEREAGTWDALLATPLEPHQLLRGKLTGILQAAIPFVAAFAIPTLALSILGGFLAFFWTLLILSITPLAMYYVGAAGIYCSVTSANSVRSFLWTLAYGYVGAQVLYGLTSLLTAVLTGIVLMFLRAFDERYGWRFQLITADEGGQLGAAVLIGSCLTMALALFLAAHDFLKRAERRLADRERVKQEDPWARSR